MSYEAVQQAIPRDKRVVCKQCGGEGYIQIRTYCDWDESLQLWTARALDEDSHYCANCDESDMGYNWRDIDD